MMRLLSPNPISSWLYELERPGTTAAPFRTGSW